MQGICVKKANSLGYTGEFLTIGEVYNIEMEDNIGYYLTGYGWVIKECISISERREQKINQIIEWK